MATTLRAQDQPEGEAEPDHRRAVGAAGTVLLDGAGLTIEAVARVARARAPVRVAAPAWAAVAAGRAVVERAIRSGRPAYGITTGFGDLCRTAIPPEQVEALQRNILLSHAVGVGEPLPEDVVRALLLVRLNTFLSGHSGVRRELVRLLVEALNRGLYPVVPEKGSLGASGDLAPSAHAALALTGEGEAFLDGRRVPGAEALAALGLAPITPAAKEGLALCNGTQLMAGAGALLLHDAAALLDTADVVGAMSVEALLGSVRPFDARVHRLRPLAGQVRSAANLAALTRDSAIVASHADCDRVQDAYSLRCIPQVHGASRDACAHAAAILEIELNSATDNPLVFPGADGGDEVISAGNFHGQPLALAFDYVAMALAELASIAERRIFRLLTPSLSEGLPPFLTPRSGLNSGYMLLQYTAAALVTENKVLCHPASVDTIPTSGGQEDHVSMGATAVMKARRVAENVGQVLAIEALCAAQALDFRLPLRGGPGTRAAHDLVRARAPHLDADRDLQADLRAAVRLVTEGGLAQVARELGR